MHRLEGYLTRKIDLSQVTYRISSIYPAVQGEGANTGIPCTIVRFQGCNLRCPFCDTRQAIDSSEGEQVTGSELLERIKDVHRPGQMVLVTGGEPLIQSIAVILHSLSRLGPVALETNGTLPVPVGFHWVTLSPKYKTLHPSALLAADEVKWLVADEGDVLDLRKFVSFTAFKGCVCVQPISCDSKATEIAYQAAIKYGYRLSLQTHKMIEKD